MGLMNKIRDIFFEETEEDEVPINDNRIAKKIEIPTKKEQHDLEEVLNTPQIKQEERKPVIFDEEDFVEDMVKEEETKEHILYGGVQKTQPKEKKVFKPSPIISPVYGVLSQNYQVEDFNGKKDLDHLFIDERKKNATFDSVRQKAYGDLTEELEATMFKEEKKEERSLLYDMEEDPKGPEIESVTVGDAEEYFKDLGLEYNVDYIDIAKNKKTRTEKNKDLSEEISRISDNEENSEEKNLYDLIDMMYENKEE